MLSNLFERAGQIVAPDPVAAAAASSAAEEEERRSAGTPTSGGGTASGGIGSAPSSGGSSGSGSRSHRGFWQIVAPDPNFPPFGTTAATDDEVERHGGELGREGNPTASNHHLRHTVVASEPASSLLSDTTIGPGVPVRDAPTISAGRDGSADEVVSTPPPADTAGAAMMSTASTPAMSSLSSTTYHTPPSVPESADDLQLQLQQPSPLRALGGSELRDSLDGTATSASDQASASTSFTTPSTRAAALLEEKRRRSHLAVVQSRVLDASRRTAEALGSPTAVWERGKAFVVLASLPPNQMTSKNVRKFTRLLTKDPTLAGVRSANMGNVVPDGFNPIHAAAHAGNLEAAKILLDFRLPSGPSTEDGDNAGDGGGRRLVSLDDRDLLGRTPLHVASKAGHVDMVRLLKEYHLREFGTEPVGEDAPVDMMDRTPLGWAVTSVERGARENRTVLEMELFSPGDRSVCPRTTPGTGGLRSTGGKGRVRRLGGEEPPLAEEGLELTYAYSDMPGYRVEQEDAISIRCPLTTSPRDGGEPVNAALFGVFDGHGDGGAASRFVADNLHRCLVETEGWRRATTTTASDGGAGAGLDDADALRSALEDACISVDELLRCEELVGDGGTTGVIALVTGSLILVANVGDSRAVLVESTDAAASGGGEEPLEAEGGAKRAVGVPLSRDHTPDLPGERERIEAAGLAVVSETFRRPGGGGGEDELVTLHKIQSGESKLSMSRSFGDFDFKCNADLPPEAQAVVATPEVVIHQRSASSSSPSSSSSVLVLACDGVWDVMDNDECADFVREKVGMCCDGTSSSSQEELGELCGEILEECLRRNSRDNMSVVLVTLPSVVGGAGAPSTTEDDDIGGARVALDFAGVGR